MCTEIKAVIFDLDGVITDTARYHYHAWKLLADELGIYFDELINERLKGIDRMASLEVILERADKVYSDEQKKEFAAKKNGYYLISIEEVTKSDILGDIENILIRLGKEGYKIALGSASKNANQIIEKLGLKDYFDAVVDSAKIAKGKPDPEIFVTAAQMLSVPCGQCVVLEDSAAGITSAKKAGMIAIGIGSIDQLYEADIIVPSVDDLTFEIIKNCAN